MAKIIGRVVTTPPPKKLSKYENDEKFVTETELANKGFAKTTDIPTDYAPKEHTHSQYLTQHQSLTDYAKKTELPTKTSQLENDSNFLTQHQSLANYYKKSETYSKSEVDTKTKQLSDEKADKTEIPSLSGYATETYVKNYAQPKGNYLTQHQDISGKANKSGWTPNMIIGVDSNGNMVARQTYTEAEKQALMQEIIDNIKVENPQAHVIYGDVDSNNNIIIFGELADGTYTLKYENEDGTITTIGTLELGGITNLSDPTSADWLVNKRLNSSGSPAETHGYGTTGGAVTNFIPCKVGDVIRVKGLKISHYWANQTDEGRATAFFYADNKSTIIAKNVPADGNGWVYENDVWSYTIGTSLTAVSGSNSDIRYARLTGRYYDGYTANDVIITINEEIVDGVYKNFLKSSTDSSGNPYNGGKGWKADTRLNSSGVETAQTGAEVTGFMPFKVGDFIEFENMKVPSTEATHNTNSYFVFYDGSYTKLKHIYTKDLAVHSGQVANVTSSDGYYVSYNSSNIASCDSNVTWSNVKYFRLSCDEITDDSSIIINKETI